jgi:hypothetical protein
MERTNFNVLSYFNYDIERVLDEFNNYYNIEYHKIPTYFRTIFLYFTNLSENSLQTLIQAKYDIKNAQDLMKIIPIHKRELTSQDIMKNMQQVKLTPLQYYGLYCFSYYFYEVFLDYIKFNNPKPLNKLASQIPIIEGNINRLKIIIKKSPQ